MAEWKDREAKKSFKKFYNKGLDMGKSIAKQNFKKYLEKKRETLYPDPYDECRCDADVLIDEIINELFKED